MKLSQKNMYIYAAILIVAALGLSFLPFFYGIGWTWTIIMAGLAIWLLLKQYAVEVPSIILATVFTVAIALQRLHIDIVSLIWIAAAALFAKAYWDNHREQLTVHNIFSHAHRFLVWGALVCLIALLLTWSGATSTAPGMVLESPNWSMSPITGQLNMSNNYMLLPGMLGNSVYGFALPFALLINIILLFLLYLHTNPVAIRYRTLGIQISLIILAIWWTWFAGFRTVFRLDVRLGSMLFLAGLLSMVYAVFLQPKNHAKEKPLLPK